MTTVSEAEKIVFIDYVYKFYGRGDGLYKEDYGNKVTVYDIYEATEQYLKETPEQWGGGDSSDRERVAFILYNKMHKDD
jgi:hypothetical protein